ncbi:MAG: hypothetical protein ACYTEQ_08655 [Planctomycetota bacterium]|jgi:hypothetical protein
MDYTVTIINTSGVHRAQLDNTGATDVSDDINDIISKFVDDNGLDLFFNPGVYLLHNPIQIKRSNISIQGYCYGFRYSPRRLGVRGKTVFLPAPSCTDAIRLGPASDRDTLHGFTLRNITIGGQNGKLDMRPDIIPPQNGVRVMENTVNGICTIDFCQFVHLTHAVINERPESVMDVWYFVDNWISECNYAIWLDSSLHGSLVSRNGFHDMTETVFHLHAVNNPRYCTHETVISDNTGWNPGKLVFDIDSFRGGSISNNSFMFNNKNCQAFARLSSVRYSNIIGNTWVSDGDSHTNAAKGCYDGDQFISILTLLGCSDCVVSHNNLLNFNKERGTILLGRNEKTKENSTNNHILLNKCISSRRRKMKSPTQVELSDGAEDNLVLLPTTAPTVDSSVARDGGSRNMFCGLPSIKVLGSATQTGKE